MIFTKKIKQLRAVCSGRCAELTEIPDEALSSGMLGEGVAIFPNDGCFFSPADGTVESVAETGHAFTLHTDDGLDLLIHVGVDTVSMKGRGFRPLVHSGDRVAAGAPLAQVELETVRRQGLPTVTALLVSNPEILETIEYRYGELVGGRDAAICYRIGRKG